MLLLEGDSSRTTFSSHQLHRLVQTPTRRVSKRVDPLRPPAKLPKKTPMKITDIMPPKKRGRRNTEISSSHAKLEGQCAATSPKLPCKRFHTFRRMCGCRNTDCIQNLSSAWRKPKSKESKSWRGRARIEQRKQRTASCPIGGHPPHV